MANSYTYFIFIVVSFNHFLLGNSSPRVFLTLSPLVRISDCSYMQREIEMNWEYDDIILNDTSDWVGLFNHDPLVSTYDPLVRINITNETVGYARTYITFPKLEFKPENLTDSCLGYWIAYINNNQIISSSCYKAQPFWMMNISHIIGNHSLDQLMIPGTHNAGSYFAFDPARNSLLIRYLMTQDESIWNQLVYGNRYLDLRVAYVDGEFWITHSVFKTDILLNDVLEEVKLFVNLTQEIVIIDFHRFETGFTGTDALYRHRELISLLETRLENLMIPKIYGYNVLLNTLWNINRRIYVGYANSAREESIYLFNGVNHQWADSDNLIGLEEYFNRTVCRQNKRNLLSSMAHLTPKTTGIIFDLYGGLRKMAHNVNLIISQWFRDRWWDCANIVCTDYFHSSDMINVAIESNRRRWDSREDSSTIPIVFLTLSSLAARSGYGIMERRIEMNWRMDDTYQNWIDPWVGLFTHDPVDCIYGALVRVNVTQSSTGYYRTHIMFPRLKFQYNKLTEACLGYWIAYVDNKKVISSSCFRARPFWMYKLAPFIGNFTLRELMIPGVHNAGCYQSFDPRLDTLLNRYLITQDESIWNQLVYGNRYLDLRVAYHSCKFWIAHGTYNTNVLLSDVLEQVNIFITSTKEIVVIDLHRFETGFNGPDDYQRHEELTFLLETRLGNYMIPVVYGYYTSLNTLWEKDYRIYVGYDHYSRLKSNYLFQGTLHLWADADNPGTLKYYLSRIVCTWQRGKRLVATMAHLTPRAPGIVFDIYGGLRKMAHDVNLNISDWFRKEWWRCANVVCTDFFHGNNIIEIAIEANRKKATLMV